MKSESQLKADNKWRQQKIKDGWRKVQFFTSPSIIQALKQLYRTLKAK